MFIANVLQPDVELLTREGALHFCQGISSCWLGISGLEEERVPLSLEHFGDAKKNLEKSIFSYREAANMLRHELIIKQAYDEVPMSEVAVVFEDIASPFRFKSQADILQAFALAIGTIIEVIERHSFILNYDDDSVFVRRLVFTSNAVQKFGIEITKLVSVSSSIIREREHSDGDAVVLGRAEFKEY